MNTIQYMKEINFQRGNRKLYNEKVKRVKYLLGHDNTNSITMHLIKVLKINSSHPPYTCILKYLDLVKGLSTSYIYLKEIPDQECSIWSSFNMTPFNSTYGLLNFSQAVFLLTKNKLKKFVLCMKWLVTLDTEEREQ